MQSHYPTYVVMLLDGRQYPCKLNVKSSTEELFDSVISYLGIQEREYFGLCYISEPGKYREWIALDKRLCEQDLPKVNGEYIVHFCVKYYIDNICWLHDPTTVEQFYLQAQESIYTKKLECDTDLCFKLAALALQEVKGDYTTDESAIRTLKKAKLIPLSNFEEFASPIFVYDEVLRHYKSLQGWSRGKAIINYLNKATELKGYGVHFYQVKDKNGVPWWIGMSPRGIAQYSLQDFYNPVQVFKWNELDNVYFRDKKFSIEVNRGSHGLSAIQQKQYSSVLMHAWYSPSSKIIKSMWQMAVNQHQFYLEKKYSQVSTTNKMKGSGARSLNDIVAELSTSVMSLDTIGYDRGPMMDSKSIESMSFSLSDTQIGTAQEDLYAALLEQRQILQERQSELRNTLMILETEESEIRGGEAAQSHVAVSTGYTIHHDVLNNTYSDVISRLELEYEIQKKIIHAAMRLAKDKGINKAIKKEREAAVQRAQLKMLDIERRLDSARRIMRTDGGTEPPRRRSNSGHRSLPDSVSDHRYNEMMETTHFDRDSPCSSSGSPRLCNSYRLPNSPGRQHSSMGSLTSRYEDRPAPLSPKLPISPQLGHDHHLRVLKTNRINSNNRLHKPDAATEFALAMQCSLSAGNNGQSTLV